MAQKPNNNTAADADELLAEAQDQDNAVAVHSSAPPLVLGEVNLPDPAELNAGNTTPVLRPAFGVGGLADAGHAPGTWVLGDYEIGKKGVPLTVYVLAANFYWRENVGYTPGQRIEPNKVQTVDEVKALGKTIEWRDGPGGKRIQPDYQPAADFILLIQQPKDILAPYFSARIGGENYATARFYADKNVYRFAGDPMLKSINGAPAPYALQFGLATQTKRLGNQTVTMPVATLLGRTEQDLCDGIAAHIGK